MNRFRIPIGDWSGDGHGRTTEYIIESNKTVEEVRELYFEAIIKLGFSLDGNGYLDKLSPCVEYGESTMSPDTVKALREFGITISDERLISWTEDYVEKDDLCQLVLDVIKTQDKDLDIRIIPKKELPMLQFYGYDSQKRHIGYFGYGLFE